MFCGRWGITFITAEGPSQNINQNINCVPWIPFLSSSTKIGLSNNRDLAPQVSYENNNSEQNNNNNNNNNNNS